MLKISKKICIQIILAFDSRMKIPSANTIFRATSTTKHKETIIAIVVLVSLRHVWSARWMSSHRTFDPFKMKLPFSMSRTAHIAGGAKDFQLNSLEK